MEKRNPVFFTFAFLFFSSSGPSLLITLGQLLPIIEDGVGNASRIQTYVIHVQRPESAKLLSDVDRENWHKSFLPNTTLDTGEPRLVYSYRNVISGFAARLTHDEMMAMASIDGFLHAHRDERLPLLTTYTPSFLGLSERDGIWYGNCFGKGAIIGVLDTGIAPTHPSFDDGGMPSPPREWRGHCDFREALCNKKLIGAAAFQGGRPLPVETDENGHGTHVAGVAAGSFVDGAAVLGNANGTSAGMAPRAHLAIYKVCSKDGCDDSDILAGMDQAIHDEVDVLSISIGSRPRSSITGSQPRPFYEDSVAIGSYAATRHRILACVAAGNDGPYQGGVVSDAPWILTVGASSTDRRIRATVRLGNGTELDGESAYQPSSFNSTLLSMAFPGYDDQGGRRGCGNDSFIDIDVEGKIVLCETGYNVSNIEKGEFVKKAGGAAMIVLNQRETGFTTFSEAHVLPAAHVSFSHALIIESYFNSSTNSTPMATIVFEGTKYGSRPSPTVASFSSRGPSLNNGGILKPDIIGPGVNILAAWPPNVEPTNQVSSSTTMFNFLSGTSVATPHLSGIAALLKNMHPHWSPAEIKSAIMTTADRLDRDMKPITDEYNGTPASLFAMGAGQVNATTANDPGLVYELHSHHYIRYLCGLGYTDQQIMAVTQHRIKCSNRHDISIDRLNYPSISVSLGSAAIKTIRRRVKNVGEDNAVYFAEIEEPAGVKVEVSPYRLEFDRLYERRHFYVTLTTSGTTPGKGQVSEGQLSWVSRKHVVRSPISVVFS